LAGLDRGDAERPRGPEARGMKESGVVVFNR
jgi:hypothetical protein